MSRYLDAAATAPLHPAAREAMNRVWGAGPGNAASVHSAGHRADRELDHARTTVARAFGVPTDGVTFTAGGTEANNLGIIGRALANPRGRRVVTTKAEHSSVLASVDFLRRIHGFTVDYLPVDGAGRVLDTAAREFLTADTTLVAVGLANAEVGSVSSIENLSATARELGISLHIDAVQAAAGLPVSFADGGWPGTGITSAAVASHKFGGPQGMGALLLPRDIALEPVIHGGEQENGRRAGTSNIAGAAGFAAAVAATRASIGTRAVELMASRDALIEAVLADVPGAALTGHPTERLPNHASFVVEGVSGESLLVALDTAGFAVSSGSACRAGQSEPSPVLLAMGYSPELAQSALRFTLPSPLNEAEIEQIVRILRAEILSVRPNG